MSRIFGRSKGDVGNGPMLPHRVRVQLAGADFPASSFEIPVDVNVTTVANVVSTASTEVARQIEDHNKTHKSDIETPLRLYANTEVCLFSF